MEGCDSKFNEYVTVELLQLITWAMSYDNRNVREATCDVVIALIVTVGRQVGQ